MLFAMTMIALATLVGLPGGAVGDVRPFAAAAAPGNREGPTNADTLRLADAAAMARAANPSLQEARLRADAATARVSQAGAWPDPQVAVGLMNRRVSDLGNVADPMSKNAFQLTQTFRWPGKLGFGEERVEHLATAERLDAEEAERRLLARMAAVYYGLAYLDRSLSVMRETRDLLRDFQQVTSAMYSVGDALQQDVLQAQVSVAQMTEDITVAEQERLAMAARLNALLGRAATAEVGAVELPRPGAEPSAVDELMQLASENRPALAAARQRVMAAESGYRAARRALYPDITLMFEYGQRPDYPDLASLMVGISLPLWAGSRQLPLRDEWQAERAAQASRELDLYNETYARLAELRAEAVRARNLAELYTSSILPQARAAVESALSAYRVGRVEYISLLNNEMTVNRYQVELVRLTAEYHRVVAEIEAIVGVELEGVS
jgi:cobalt-zinc-cadmium efflux system outer membrane protein